MSARTIVILGHWGGSTTIHLPESFRILSAQQDVAQPRVVVYAEADPQEMTRAVHFMTIDEPYKPIPEGFRFHCAVLGAPAPTFLYLKNTWEDYRQAEWERKHGINQPSLSETPRKEQPL